MVGYLHDPLQIINLIADNLRDRYKSGFPVLKEIIQNADDAGLSDEKIQLEFGLSQGLKSAEHPLLKGAALFFINNGIFREEDYKAIRSFGLNRKAIEQSSIGKFGLGMKSVFHFCEAFFFLAENKDKKYAEILNPWSGSEEFVSFHDDWNVFTESDNDLILQYVKPVLSKLRRSNGGYFLLWLPLRKKQHLIVNDKEVGSIISEFPGDNEALLSFLLQTELAQKTASLLPLLRRITSIRLWNTRKQTNELASIFQVLLRKEATRIGLPEQFQTLQNIEGSIGYTYRSENSLQYSYTYSGRESLLNSPELQSLKQSEFWPKSFVRDDQGKSRQAPDKAKGHCAVVFSRSNEKQIGQLKIRWAVFLPVEAGKEDVSCGGESGFRMTLHGYFFVDAGRVDIEGLQQNIEADEVPTTPNNELELRRIWNTRLAEQGTLPLVIPSLADFSKKARLSIADFEHLCYGLKESKFFRQHRKSVCNKISLICCLTKDKKVWRQVPKDTDMLPLPGPPVKSPERPWVTFPKLTVFEEKGTRIVLRESEAPHLHDKQIPQWDETSLLDLLHINEKTVFSNQGCLDYLITFLNDQSVRPFLNIYDMQTRLIDIFSRAFFELGAALRENRTKVQEYISLIQPGNRFILRQKDLKVLRELQSCDTKTLIIPNEFDEPDSPGKAKLSMEDTLVVLSRLHDLITSYELKGKQKLVDNCRALTRDILRSQDGDSLKRIIIQARHLKILEGFDCRMEKLVALSLAELEATQNQKLLFRYFPPPGSIEHRLGLAPKFKAAIESNIILISKETSDLVFGKQNKIMLCDADSVLDSLGYESRNLQSESNRRELIQGLAGSELERNEIRIRGLRYLLHGYSDYFEQNTTLWVSGYNQNPVWEKLWEQLTSEQKDQWNLLKRELLEELPSNKWPFLSIREIKPEDILGEIRDRGAENINGKDFTLDERNAVLNLINDESLWKAFPFHETVNGQLVNIKPDTSFLETDIVLPDELYDYADIIKVSSDPAVKNQQKTWLSRLSSKSVTQTVFCHDKPSKFCHLVMDHLNPYELSELKTSIQEIQWLLDTNNNPVRPFDVVYLGQMQNEVDRLLSTARGAYWSPGSLHEDLKQHPSFDFLLKHYFSTGEDGFEILGALLGETKEYYIGYLNTPVHDLEKVINICTRLPMEFNLPGWALLKNAIENYPLELIDQYLIPGMLKHISIARIIQILNWLCENHIVADPVVKDQFIISFNTYLAAFVNESGRLIDLKDVRLLSQEGTWKCSHELCAGAEGVADSHLLDADQKRLLKDVIVTADVLKVPEDEDNVLSRKDLALEISASAEELRGFFSDWEGLVAPEIICAFISLLGDDESMINLAGQYRGRHSVKWIRENIPWTINRDSDRGKQGWLYGMNQHDALAQHRFIVTCTDGKIVSIASILGDEIDVPLRSKFTSLITGGLFYEYPTGSVSNVRIQLRRPSVEDIPPSELSALLRSSTEYLLEKAYDQKDCDLSNLWEELDKSEQLDIRIAQQLVLNHLPFYIRQLGVHKHCKLQSLLKKWNDARYKQEEYYESPEKKKEFEKEERNLLSEIQDLLQGDEEVQTVVLNAVRSKIEDFQYTLGSIPFELFQNADDAVVELAEINSHFRPEKVIDPDLLPEHIKRFMVILNENSFSIMHWGRPVNSIGPTGFPGRERGFHQDLEKMLLLSASDKSSNHKVTGKFGLGFKSVLLACDKPRIISGQLSTEIIAGLCPVLLKDTSQLRALLKEKTSDRKYQATLVNLPFKETMPEEIMSGFNQLAGFMTIFSKQIRRIDVTGGREQTWNWNPTKRVLGEGLSIEIDRTPLLKNDPSNLSLYFRLNKGGILTAFGPQGFRKLPDQLPAIWVVTPITEMKGLGIAINCDFELDAGRGRLSGSSAINREKAKKLGSEFGKALQQLFELTQTQWEELKQALRLESDLTVYQFWSSFWNVINHEMIFRTGDEVSITLKSILCKDRGLGYLCADQKALPNNLWGDYQALTRLDKIKIVLKGCLGNETIFRYIEKWEFFRNLLGEPDSVVLRSIFSLVKKFCPQINAATDQWKSIGLIDVLYEFSRNNRQVDEKTAALLGRLFTAEEFRQGEYQLEKEQAYPLLYKLLFKAKDGSSQIANTLLMTQKHKLENPDEEKRALFAPDQFVLSDDYQEYGIDCFLTCREKIALPLEKLAEWIIEAQSEIKRINALKYLLNGEHGDKVARIVREQGIENTWLAELHPDSSYFKGWPNDDIDEVRLRKLKSTEELRDRFTFFEDDFDDMFWGNVERHDPKTVLQRIHQWWGDEKDEYITDYEKHIYPEDFIIDLNEDEAGRIDRKSWMVLFTLSHFHTMGRQRDVQHRGFIQKCIKKGWWDIFSKEKPEERSDEWMRVLEEDIIEQIESSEYEVWMNHFPILYKFSRWLDDFKEAFCSINRMEELPDLSGILKTRTNPQFQGGGISAPPIEKSLGLGACFALRELKRNKIINRTIANPFCYVPVRRVRHFFENLGCTDILDNGDIENSRIIHNYLCQNLGEDNVTFSNCFDIPLQIITEDEELLGMILE